MTTVLGLCSPAGVWMGADSRTNVGNRPLNGAAHKIIRLPHASGELLIGISGNAGIPSRIRQAWPTVAAPPAGDDIHEWAEEVAGVVTQAMRDAAMVTDDGRMESELLLAVAGHLWTIYHYAALPSPGGMAAVGSGSLAALGALDVLLENGVNGEAAVRRAVDAAMRLDMWSGPPVQIESLLVA